MEILLLLGLIGWLWYRWRKKKKARRIEIDTRPRSTQTVVPPKIAAKAAAKRHHSVQDFARACYQAYQYLQSPEDYLILDTETTGLDDDALVIELALCGLDGKSVFDSRFALPAGRKVPAKATQVHGITTADLAGAPDFRDRYEVLKVLLENYTILIYNEDYDVRLLDQTCAAWGMPAFRMKSKCIMLQYAAYVGEWNDYRFDYRWQKLPSGDHSAMGDCLATLKLIRKMGKEWE
jgi:DNA polymerase-3 subunit epsilon